MTNRKRLFIVAAAAADSQSILTLTGCNHTVLCYIVHPLTLCYEITRLFSMFLLLFVSVWTPSVFVVFLLNVFWISMEVFFFFLNDGDVGDGGRFRDAL